MNNLVEQSAANLQQSQLHPHKIIQNFTSTDCYKFSVVTLAVQLWNWLLAYVDQAPMIGIFHPAVQAVIDQTYLIHFVSPTLSVDNMYVAPNKLLMHLNSSIKTVRV